ncbi:hypothetical protein RRG08_006737 [Elysia crispata]|uniref:Uncharacterized protein n=1 Tax=Elysia crispata TaxID=231223 RepID=A0AAE1AEF0_9GAST|nr:hypothetical protein RRG08_006737 [Elysia crispata]
MGKNKKSRVVATMTYIAILRPRHCVFSVSIPNLGSQGVCGRFSPPVITGFNRCVIISSTLKTLITRREGINQDTNPQDTNPGATRTFHHC